MRSLAPAARCEERAPFRCCSTPLAHPHTLALTRTLQERRLPDGVPALASSSAAAAISAIGTDAPLRQAEAQRLVLVLQRLQLLLPTATPLAATLGFASVVPPRAALIAKVS